LPTDVYETIIIWGYILKAKIKAGKEREFDHPAAMATDFLEELFWDYKPDSVLDPMLGTGVTAEVCESLGIRWTGFELLEKYRNDITYRIHRGQRRSEAVKRRLARSKKKKCAGKQTALF